jgi:Mn-dependent DtxR family transcriptional regulator
MLDKDLVAELIGIVKHSTSVTVARVANELDISEDKAETILNQLEDCKLIVWFGGFYACTDLAELN